jgi:subtilisin family serine protease
MQPEDGSMAQDKEERPSTANRKTAETSDDMASAKKPATATVRPIQREVESVADNVIAVSMPGRRREQYVIGWRAAASAPPPAYAPHSMDEVVDYLNRQEGVEVIKRVKLGGARPFAAKSDSVDEVVVTRIDESRAQRLREAAPAHLIIERDARLQCADYLAVPSRSTPIGMLLPLQPLATEVSIRVIGENDQPLIRAAVVIDAGGLPAQGLTDESGLARITFFGGSLESIQTLFIRAGANHWDRLIETPRLSPGTNTVKLRSLAEVYPHFPAHKLQGWGQRLLGLEPGSGRLDGKGIKIGVIDSGCDNTHPLLKQVAQGKDFTASASDAGWAQDMLSHGTHCSGIINASSLGEGVVGCAPGAELHAFKVLPGGHVSDLVAALDECIQRELDIINISVVSTSFSELVAQKLQEARQKGIACIVAAGNNAYSPPLFPATLPGVMTVAAIGKLKEFPADSSQVLSIIPQLVDADEVFPAAFSSVGPQIDISAPGVAIVSTVPGGGYAAADGTSAAASHITGLAAVVMAHHPLFQEGSWAMRSEHRVRALFELIRTSAVPRFFDAQRGGAGVPDLRRIPAGHNFARGLLASDGADAVGMPPSWPMPVQGWSAWLSPRAVGF